MRNCLFCGIGVGVVLLIVAAVLGWAVFPGVIESRIGESVSLVPGTIQMDRFEETPQPLTFKIYFFKVLNPDAIHTGGKPEVEEVGPYVYKQYRKKEDVNFVRNQRQVEFHQGREYEFDAVASFPLTEDDEITWINIVANGVYQNDNPTLGPAFDNFFVEIFGRPQTTIFQTYRVGDLMFDGHTFCHPNTEINLVNIYCSLLLTTGSETVTQNPDNSYDFAFFKHKGNKFDGKYTVNTGIRDPLLVGDIELWEDSPTVSFWKDNVDEENVVTKSVCNQIKGTDSSIYPPFRKTEGSMFTYSTDICRSVEIHYKREATYEGIAGYTYEAGLDFLNQIGPDYENECYCINNNAFAIKQENGCLYPGALDLSTCVKSPIVLTQPHFLETSEEYTSLIDGLSPNEEKHRTFVTVEKNSGTPLQGGKRVQFNMFLSPDRDFPLTRTLPRVLLPLLWVDEGIALNEEMVGVVNDSLSALSIVPIVVWTLFGVGLAAIVGCSVVFYFTKNRSSNDLI